MHQIIEDQKKKETKEEHAEFIASGYVTLGQSEKKPSRLIPLTHWNRFHEWPPTGGLRHLAFFSANNGFAKAFLKVGRRLLIDEAEFFRVVREKNKTEK